MKSALIVATLFLLLLPSCSDNSKSNVQPVVLPPVDGIEYCGAAQQHLQDLGCIPKSKPYTAKGKSFKQFCEDTMNNQINLHPNCLANITNCNQMNACVQAKD